MARNIRNEMLLTILLGNPYILHGSLHVLVAVSFSSLLGNHLNSCIFTQLFTCSLADVIA